MSALKARPAYVIGGSILVVAIVAVVVILLVHRSDTDPGKVAQRWAQAKLAGDEDGAAKDACRPDVALPNAGLVGLGGGSTVSVVAVDGAKPDWQVTLAAGGSTFDVSVTEQDGHPVVCD